MQIITELSLQPEPINGCRMFVTWDSKCIVTVGLCCQIWQKWLFLVYSWFLYDLKRLNDNYEISFAIPVLPMNRAIEWCIDCRDWLRIVEVLARVVTFSLAKTCAPVHFSCFKYLKINCGNILKNSRSKVLFWALACSKDYLRLF